MRLKGKVHKTPPGKRNVKSVLLASIVICAIGYTWFYKPELTPQSVVAPIPSASSATSTDTSLSSDRSSLQQTSSTASITKSTTKSTGDGEEPPSTSNYRYYLANRNPEALRTEGAESCRDQCQHPIAGLALHPPQKAYWFEGHSERDGGGQSQQTHPARAVWEIHQSGAAMSMKAVDIGAAGGSPECGPLFGGEYGMKWGGAKVDARPIASTPGVRNIPHIAEPQTIAKFLVDACIPPDLDILKIDIDCYDWEVTKAILDAGFRPKIFTAEIAIPIPPPIHFHEGWTPNFQWTLVSTRPKEQQIMYGASLSAYSDLLRPLGYTLLGVDYYNCVYVQNKYRHLFGDSIPTDDYSAWRAGWFDRPERLNQKDLQKYWLRFPLHDEWVEIADETERLQAIVDYFNRNKDSSATVIQDFSNVVKDADPWSSPAKCSEDSPPK